MRRCAIPLPTRWAARVDNDTGNWSAWVNVTVPVGTTLAQVHVMAPQLARGETTCVWECGTGRPAAFSSTWVSFGSAAGYYKLRAIPPLAPVTMQNVDWQTCQAVWRFGSAAPKLATTSQWSRHPRKTNHAMHGICRVESIESFSGCVSINFILYGSFIRVSHI